MTDQKIKLSKKIDKYNLQSALFMKKDLSIYLEGISGTVKMRVSSVQAEDGSKESWNVEGYVNRHPRIKGSLPRVGGWRVFMYCRTDSLSGGIRYFEDKS